MKRAFFMLQDSDLDQPDEFLDYNLLVCNPDLSPEKFLAFREELFARRVTVPTYLAYDNCIDAPSPTWQSDYWRDKSEILKRHHVGATWWNDCPGYLLDGPTAMRLAGFHKARTLPRGFNGMYLDLCRETWPPSRNVEFDQSVAADYPFQRQRYTAMLRRHLGLSILIGNSNSPIMDPCLNGCSLENVGKDISLVEALGLYTQQRQVSVDPQIAIAWTHDGEDASSAERLAEACDWIYAGRVRKEA